MFYVKIRIPAIAELKRLAKNVSNSILIVMVFKVTH